MYESLNSRGLLIPCSSFWLDHSPSVFPLSVMQIDEGMIMRSCLCWMLKQEARVNQACLLSCSPCPICRLQKTDTCFMHILLTETKHFLIRHALIVYYSTLGPEALYHNTISNFQTISPVIHDHCQPPNWWNVKSRLITIFLDILDFKHFRHSKSLIFQ